MNCQRYFAQRNHSSIKKPQQSIILIYIFLRVVAGQANSFIDTYNNIIFGEHFADAKRKRNMYNLLLYKERKKNTTDIAGFSQPGV